MSTLNPYDFEYFPDFTDGSDIQDAAKATLQKYFHTYLGAWERKKNRTPGSMLRPSKGSYSTSINEDWADRPDGDLPGVVIVCPGLLDEPTVHGGRVTLKWALGIGVVCSGVDAKDAEKNAKGYGSCVRNIFMRQARSLGGVIDALTYVNERYDEYDPTDNNTQFLATAMLSWVAEVTVDGRFGKIPDHLIDPEEENPGSEDPTPPTVQSTHTTIRKPGTAEIATSETSVEIS